MNKQKAEVATSNEEFTCPLCDAPAFTEWKTHRFPYGEGESQVELQVYLPVRCCSKCEFQYTDWVGEELEHEAVCKHLNLLSPKEIRAIRTKYGMTRAEFAEQTGLGEASIGRWERGELMQSHANDRYLRLLALEDGMSRLRLVLARTYQQSFTASSKPVGNQFRIISINQQTRQHQANFELNPMLKVA